MKPETVKQYRPYRPVELPDRSWPDRQILSAPIWCSVDLRDGNQALPVPMNIPQKKQLFAELVRIGFREIEVGFPAAAAVEFDFVRELIERDLIPDDVTIQVLTQAREPLIRRTMEAIRGARQAIVHVYNSTSPAQRRDVFGMSRDQIKAIATDGVRLIRELAAESDADVRLEYSPESFSQTEVDFALEVCEAVVDVWRPTRERRIILNLPATVEASTPNLYADQIEWFCRHLRARETAIVSLHTHNDRGTGVAATELGLLAGADRVEGTLFGNGERTGNLDLVTTALNLHTQGVDPELDFHDLGKIRSIYEETVRMPVHPRHPYAGELVYTAFSGSHQDAIRKATAARAADGGRELWDLPYLPINPEDVARQYEPIIRINSQSGKGGAAFVMQNDHGYDLPRAMHSDFAALVQRIAEATGQEVPPEDILGAFREGYLDVSGPFELKSFRSSSGDGDSADQVRCEIEMIAHGRPCSPTGTGNGPLDACRDALVAARIADFRLVDYHEHSLARGSNAAAAAYIALEIDGREWWGAGEDRNIVRAGVRAVFAALNRHAGNATPRTPAAARDATAAGAVD